MLLVGGADGVSAAQNEVSQSDSRQQLLAHPEKIPLLLKQEKLTSKQIPDPHWKTDACTACHTKKSGAGRKNLRHKSIDKTCNTCHASSLSAHNYIHISNVDVPKAMFKRMSKSFRDSVVRGGNKITCISCHDLPMTCQKKRYNERDLNPLFFRGGPYKLRTDLCYKCHDESKYQRVNAHDQINDKGELQKDKCLICHTTNKDLLKAKSIDEVEFNLKDNLSRLCWGCHKWEPHPGSLVAFFTGRAGESIHLVKPPEAILERLLEKQKEHDIIFPLEPGTGKVFCGTCHNPHERGVIKNKQAAKGADAKKRLRMQNICRNCHEK